jgi:hypothetical protein
VSQRGVSTSYFFPSNSFARGLLKEGRHGHSIEVKHLSAGELSITDLIEAEHLTFKLLS